MTPKEKAEEIVNKFYKYANSTDFNHLTGDFYTNNILWLNNTKQIALICLKMELDAKIEAFNSMEEFQPDIASQGIIFANREYNEVKQEIEKL